MERFTEFWSGINFRILAGNITACILAFIGFGLFINGFALIAYFPDNRQSIKCSDTTCLLSIFHDKCYAKFEFYPDAKYELVKCGARYGYGNTTVPCNVADDNTPIIDCEKRMMNKSLYTLIVIFLAIGHVLFGIAVLGASLSIFGIIKDYENRLVNLGDKKVEMDQMKQSDQTDQSDQNLQTTKNANLVQLDVE